MPLGLILTDRFLVTVCKFDNDILQEFGSGRVKGFSTAKRHRFVLQILLATSNRYLAYLRGLNKAIDLTEDRLQKSTRNREVLELLKFQKSLTLFTTALKSNELMLERLQRSRLFQTYPEDEDLLDDVITENQQAIEMTNIATNILSGTMDAFASIISNNLNAVMKFLASITILISLPTMIASYFGMNVHIPFEDNPYAFVFIIIMTVGIGLVATYIFWKRDWL
jgi:magnesium transporter